MVPSGVPRSPSVCELGSANLPCHPSTCRYPVVIAATEEELVTGEETDPEVEPPPVVSLSVVSQPGLPRRQVYYPYIAWRLSRVLQVRCNVGRLPPGQSHALS